MQLISLIEHKRTEELHLYSAIVILNFEFILIFHITLSLKSKRFLKLVFSYLILIIKL